MGSQALGYSGHILMEKHITWFYCVCVHALHTKVLFNRNIPTRTASLWWRHIIEEGSAFFAQYKEEDILILVHGHDYVHKPTE